TPRVGGGDGHMSGTLGATAARSTSACHRPEGPRGEGAGAVSTLIEIRLIQFPPPASLEQRTAMPHKMPEWHLGVPARWRTPRLRPLHRGLQTLLPEPRHSCRDSC